MTTLTPNRSAHEYDRIAPFYDAFTTGYAYDRWLAALEHRARLLGLHGDRALDLACGTGKSTQPLLARGYTVAGCDSSREMIRQARLKFPDLASAFVVADMRELPELGRYDLIVCLDDALNYLLSDDDLEATFHGVRRLLAPEGVFVFDVNSLRTYRTSFSQADVREADGLLFAWQGRASAEFEAGELATSTVDIFELADDGR